MATATLPAKRKRAQISYMHDDELDELLGGEDVSFDAGGQSDNEDDETYGSRKKPASKTRKAKKAKVAAEKRAKRNEKPFPFLSLPAELRDHIYELALTDKNGIHLVGKTKAWKRIVAPGIMASEEPYGYYRRNRRRARTQSQESEGEPARNPLIPALLAVNKQVYAETVNYLYQQEITVEDTYALHSFLAGLGSHQSRITDLTVRGYGGGRGTHKAMNFCSFTLLSGCTNLKSLYFDCSIGYGRNPRGLARQIYRDGFHFLEAFGTANGAKDAAVDILQLSDWNYDKNNIGWYRRNETLPDRDGFEAQFRAELRRLLGC